MRLFTVCIVVACLCATAVHAQNTRYSTWSNPADSSPGANPGVPQAFIDKLNTLIDEAEKANAADPVFLQDLRNLATGAVNPWNTVVLDDAFADGNFTANPAWDVLSGEYFIETGWGLRNRLITAQQSQQSSGNSGDDLAKAIFGQILQRATGAQGTTSSTPGENIIVTRTAISNAFSLDVEMSSWQADSHFEVGVFSGRTGVRRIQAAVRQRQGPAGAPGRQFGLQRRRHVGTGDARRQELPSDFVDPRHRRRNAHQPRRQGNDLRHRPGVFRSLRGGAHFRHGG